MSSSNPQIPPYHPDQPEVAVPPLPEQIPDPPEETPLEDQVIPPSSERSSGTLPPLPHVVLGCATFGYGIYSRDEDLASDIPLRTVRYALRSGVTAFDTAPWYHPSEQILGQALQRLKSEFPRSSYQIITKVGKYGPGLKEHMYDADVVRKSVRRSLKRLDTDYLDVVYLHDVEFLSPLKFPSGNHLPALKASPDDPYHLQPPHKSLGPGDDNILEGLRTLRSLQKEGKIRRIGICAFPLPTLLRIALLAAATPDVGPLDIVQTYGHQSLNNATLSEGYLEALERAGVKQVMNAAVLAMGVLTTAGAPEWHPLRTENGGEAYKASREASEWCLKNGTKLENVAIQFGFRELRSPEGTRVPIVVGCKNVDEVKRTVAAWRDTNLKPEEPAVAEQIAAVRKIFTDRGVQGYSYASPSPGTK